MHNHTHKYWPRLRSITLEIYGCYYAKIKPIMTLLTFFDHISTNLVHWIAGWQSDEEKRLACGAESDINI